MKHLDGLSSLDWFCRFADSVRLKHFSRSTHDVPRNSILYIAYTAPGSPVSFAHIAVPTGPLRPEATSADRGQAWSTVGTAFATPHHTRASRPQTPLSLLANLVSLWRSFFRFAPSPEAHPAMRKRLSTGPRHRVSRPTRGCTQLGS